MVRKKDFGLHADKKDCICFSDFIFYTFAAIFKRL